MCNVCNKCAEATNDLPQLQRCDGSPSDTRWGFLFLGPRKRDGERADLSNKSRIYPLVN